MESLIRFPRRNSTQGCIHVMVSVFPFLLVSRSPYPFMTSANRHLYTQLSSSYTLATPLPQHKNLNIYKINTHTYLSLTSL